MPAALDQFLGTTCNHSQEMNLPYTERSIEVKELNFLGKISTKHCIGNVATPFTSVSSPSIYSNFFCKKILWRRKQYFLLLKYGNSTKFNFCYIVWISFEKTATLCTPEWDCWDMPIYINFKSLWYYYIKQY